MKADKFKNGVIFQGDCLEVMDKLIENGTKVDCIITDIPYGTTACKWDEVIPFDKMWDRINKIVKNDSAICLFGSQPFTSKLICSNLEMFKYELIWNKKTGLGFLDSKFRPLKSHENIILFSKGGCSNGSKIQMKYYPQGLIKTEKKNRNSKSNILNSEPKKRKELDTKYTNYPKSIHEFPRETGLHPTQKPIALMEYLIKTYTNENEVVLDFTMGSATTCVACQNTNRKFIGIELDNNYYEISKNRLEENENLTNK